MERVYKLEDLRSWSDETIRLGVIGDPVEHSRSPQMMNAALGHCGFSHRYGRFHIGPGEVREALQLMRERDFVGANITIPHKIAATSLMDYVNDVCVALGAVNTVQFRHGKLRGFNTDAIGFERAIREEFGVDPHDMRVLILGCGGAARAVASVCGEARMWSRRDEADLRELARGADLIVNATPVGMNEGDPLLLSHADFRADQFVFDTIYSPPETKLMRAAGRAGARVANGLSMLLHQGAAAFEIWFNQPAPVEVMRPALL